MDAHPTAKTTTPEFNKKFNDFFPPLSIQITSSSMTKNINNKKAAHRCQLSLSTSTKQFSVKI